MLSGRLYRRRPSETIVDGGLSWTVCRLSRDTRRVDLHKPLSSERIVDGVLSWSVYRLALLDALTIFALDSRQRSPVRSSSMLRSSDVAFPPGHESRTPKMSRRYSNKQLLIAGVFPSRPHRRPGLSSAPSPLLEWRSFERHPRTDEVL